MTLALCLLLAQDFDARYAALIEKLRQAVAGGRGLDAAHKALLSTSADTPKAADHLRALAESLRKAIACSACEAKGKVACQPCKGEGRRDLPCKDCKGEGRVKPPGVLERSKRR